MKKDKQLVSVLMPAYNCEKFIKQAINSILNQTYKNTELLIADDASTDNTCKIIESFNDNRIKTFHNNKNLGYAKTCNKLFALSSGDYITFQDADDFSKQNRIELLVNEFLKDKELGFCGSDFIYTTKSGEISEYSNSLYNSNEEIKKNIFEHHLVCGATIMVTKKALNDTGYYNKYFFNKISFQDYYWAALIILKYKSIILKNHLYYRRLNSDSISQKRNTRQALYGYYSVLFLLNQRKNTGTDYLESGHPDKLKSYVHKKLAWYKFEQKKYKSTIFELIKAIKSRPFEIYNYRTLFYFTKKIFFNILCKK